MTQDEEEKALSRIIRFLDVVRVYAQDFPPFSDYGTDKPMHWKTKEIQELALSLFNGKCASEPVAWPCLIDSADFSENTITLVMQCDDYKVSAGTHWLSTTPPQRKPLTDEKIETLWQNTSPYYDHQDFARSIKQAHGIKENT